MSRAYRCSACNNEVDVHATVCSSMSCRKPLALCSHCRDITTYTLVEKANGRLKRDRWKCDRCERVGVRCLTWVAGGYCNGLARGGEHLDMPLCASCGGRASDIGRGMIGYALMGAVSLIFRRRK